ncbi:MAG: hypothetical protein OQJ89_06895 [Kangiellaceae bacterium]|nr:hypothetical protein [Kangiellaceae bacterium]MCW9016671.1 hypothetical protein [Kangiellaceae bacterium]
MNIFEILEKIKQRAGMYLGAASIVRLKSFLDGYYFLRENVDNEEQFWNQFQQ